MELAWLKDWAGQGIAVVVCLFAMWIFYVCLKAAWSHWRQDLWPVAKTHIDTVNNTLATLGTNEIRQTSLMESMNGQLSTHTLILDKHGQRLDEHGRILDEIHQAVRKPGGSQ